MAKDDNKVGVTDFFRLFLASILGAIAGTMLGRINLYSPSTQAWGLLWFFSLSALFYILYFYIPKFVPTLKPKKRLKLSKDTKDILLLLLTLLLIFIVFFLPRLFPAWFNS